MKIINISSSAQGEETMHGTSHTMRRLIAALTLAAMLTGALFTGIATIASARAADGDDRTETISIVETRTSDELECKFQGQPIPCALVKPFCHGPIPEISCTVKQLIDRDRAETTYTLSKGDEPIALVDFWDLCEADWASACDIGFYFGCGYGVLPDCPTHPWQDSGPTDDGELKDRR